MIHTLKIDDKWYARLDAGQKKAELRINDRDYQVDDTICFEVCTEDQPSWFTNAEDYLITHVLTSDVCDGLEDGYCILSLQKVIHEPDNTTN